MTGLPGDWCNGESFIILFVVRNFPEKNKKIDITACFNFYLKIYLSQLLDEITHSKENSSW